MGEGKVPAVSIVRVEHDHVEAAVRRAVELAGGLPEGISAGSTVLIKPNVVALARPDRARSPRPG